MTVLQVADAVMIGLVAGVVLSVLLVAVRTGTFARPYQPVRYQPRHARPHPVAVLAAQLAAPLKLYPMRT